MITVVGLRKKTIMKRPRSFIKCIADGCKAEAEVKGYCRKCYQRNYYRDNMEKIKNYQAFKNRQSTDMSKKCTSKPCERIVHRHQYLTHSRFMKMTPEQIIRSWDQIFYHWVYPTIAYKGEN